MPRKLIPVLLVALALAARLIPGPRPVDDSFITFRYARNLLAGEGFVFNPGERVQGTTTPLYTLLMAGLGAVSGGGDAPFSSLALGVNALADAATCLLLWRIGKRLGSGTAGLAAALVWAVAPYSVTFAIGGLETSLYVLLLTGAAAAYLERRHTLTALCAALALLTRPDAVLLVGPLILDRLVRALRGGPAERLTGREVLVFVLPCLAWGAFAWAYFGSPIPHSVQAKLAVYRLEPSASLVRLIQHYTTPFLQHRLLGAAAGVALGLALYPFLYFIGARHAFKAEPRALAWLLYPWIYFIVFALPNPLLFRWYLTPPLPAYFLVILIGAEELLRALVAGKTKDRAALPPSRSRLAAVLVALFVFVLPLVTTLSDWQLRPDHGPDRPAPSMAWFKLELLYRQAAARLSPRMTADTLLAAGDVGMLGFYTPARILDTVGLNSPRALAYYPLDAQYYVINYAIPSRLILDARPDFVVILEVYGRLTLLRDADFARQYRLVETIPTDIYDSRGMLLYERVP